MPAGMDFHEAVVCEGAWYANSNLQALGVGSGHRILIYGASGAIGTARYNWRSPTGGGDSGRCDRHVDLARSLGADHVVDFALHDYTRIGETFDFILDAVGKASYFRGGGSSNHKGSSQPRTLTPQPERVPPALGTISRRRRLSSHAEEAVETSLSS